MMLALPESGMSSSRSSHNVNFDYFCDWLEATVLFQEDPVSMSDVLDILLENEVYVDQDFAEQLVANAWVVVGWRFKTLGNPLGLSATGTRLEKEVGWENYPAYAFCLLVTCTSYLYPTATAAYADYTEQGGLFERLSCESLAQMLPGWTVKAIGWTPENPVKLRDSISDITASMNELPGAEVELHVTASANEIGLDVLAYKRYNDSHSSLPVFMLQCASGKDWKRKRKTPDLAIWRKIVSFNSNPVRGMTIPYAFADQSTFRKEATPVEGVFLDRYRLLSPVATNGDWISPELNADLRSFVAARVAALPTSARSA